MRRDESRGRETRTTHNRKRGAKQVPGIMNSHDAATQAPDVLDSATMDTGGGGGGGGDHSTDSCRDGYRDDTTTMEDDGNQYVKQQRMIEEIAEQIKQQQTLTSVPLPISTLRQQYVDNPNFIVGIELVEKSYSHLRTIRGDGNCYYRAFLYSLLETLIQKQQHQQQQQLPTSDKSTTCSSIDSEGQRLLQYVTHESFEQILQQNYDETAVEIFHDEMIELFQNVIEKRIYGATNGDHRHESTTTTAATSTTATTFHDLLNQENAVSDYCTWYLRLVTATYMKQDPDRFLPFVLSASQNDDAVIVDIHQFCSKYIEPMGQECEHVQVLALAEAFQIHVTVVYLDGRHVSLNSDNRNLQHHDFGPDTSPIRLTLLYRPGHYDILYKK